MTSRAGWYIVINITNLPVGLGDKLMEDQCTTSTTGRYIGIGITQLPVELGGTSM